MSEDEQEPENPWTKKWGALSHADEQQIHLTEALLEEAFEQAMKEPAMRRGPVFVTTKRELERFGATGMWPRTGYWGML